MTDKHPNPTSLLELAAKVEAATGPDRELDRRIQMAVRKREPLLQADRPPMKPRYYTASLDAAMTLVPAGWELWIYSTGNTPMAILTDEAWFEDRPDGRLVQADAATPALALTAAALKARAHAD